MNQHLYNKIMLDIAKIVKKHIDESFTGWSE